MNVNPLARLYEGEPNQDKIDLAIDALQKRGCQETERVCRWLDQAIFKWLDHNSLSEPSRKACLEILDKYPKRFSTVSVTMGENSVTVPKIKLMLLSEKFHKALQAGTPTGRINLALPKENPSSLVPAFLNYIHSGHLTLTEENALPLLAFSREHGLKDLEENCLGIFEAYLLSGLQHQIPSLIRQCLQFCNQNKKNPSFQQVLQNVQSEEVKIFLHLVHEAEEYGISLSISEKSITIKLTKKEGFSKKALKIIEKLQKCVPFKGISAKVNVGIDDLEKLFKIIPVITSLVITDNNIELIPTAWMQQLEELNFSNCPKLKSVDAPRAKLLICAWCPSLTEIKGPHAAKIFHNDCPKLTTITVPNYCEVFTPD